MGRPRIRVVAGTGESMRGCRIADVLDVRVIIGTVRRVLLPQCGGITLDALTVGRCDWIIQAITLSRSVSAARPQHLSSSGGPHTRLSSARARERADHENQLRRQRRGGRADHRRCA